MKALQTLVFLALVAVASGWYAAGSCSRPDPAAEQRASEHEQRMWEAKLHEARLDMMNDALSEAYPTGDIFLGACFDAELGGGPLVLIIVKDGWYALGGLQRRKLAYELSATWRRISEGVGWTEIVDERGRRVSDHEQEKCEARLAELNVVLDLFDPSRELFWKDSAQSVSGETVQVLVKDRWHQLGELDRRKLVHQVSGAWRNITEGESENCILMDERGVELGGNLGMGEFIE